MTAAAHTNAPLFSIEELTEFFACLDNLRLLLGKIDMFDAVLYGRKAFDLDIREAHVVVLAWMRTFAEGETPAARAALAAARGDSEAKP